MDDKKNPFLKTLRIPVKNSPILYFTVFGVHIMCLFLPWLTGLAIYINILLICLAVISFYTFHCKYQPFMDNNNVDTLILDAEDRWQIILNNDTSHHAELGKSLFVHPWLTIISLKFNNNQKYFIFTPEIVEADLFRRLRVRLRFKVGK